MAIQVAETSKPKKMGAKVIDHLELHPKMGGGHIVKHVYTNHEHEPTSYSFNSKGIAKGGEHITAHLAKHAGLPDYDRGAEEEAEGEEGMEA